MKRIIAMGVFSAILGLFSCNAQSSDNAFKSVEVEEFAKVKGVDRVFMLPSSIHEVLLIPDIRISFFH